MIYFWQKYCIDELWYNAWYIFLQVLGFVNILQPGYILTSNLTSLRNVNQKPFKGNETSNRKRTWQMDGRLSISV